MHMLSALVLVVVVGYVNAKFAFPVPSYYAVEKAFRTVRAGMKWDPTNLLTDLAGPLAMCDRLTDWGATGKKVTPAQAETVWNAVKIDPVFFPARDSYAVYYFVLSSTGADSRSVHNDINAAVQNLGRANFQAAPYTELSSDLQSTERFGCSVEPQCPAASGQQGKTVIVCLFQQSTVPPPMFMQGLNETWGVHCHDVYQKVAENHFSEGNEFGYMYLSDEVDVLKTVVGNDLCDKHAYDPKGFENTVKAYWQNPDLPQFHHTLGQDKSKIGWYLAQVENKNATSGAFMQLTSVGTIPQQFLTSVVFKLLPRVPTNTGPNLLTKSAPMDLNAGGCVMAICPGRFLPKGGLAGGKQTVKGNYAVLGCMTFKSDEFARE